MTVNVFGAGLAGCEAAYQLAKRGVKVKLYDIKPHKKTPAQTLFEYYMFSKTCLCRSLFMNFLLQSKKRIPVIVQVIAEC